MSREYSENVLVQNSAGNLLQNVLGWEVVLAYNSEKLGPDGTLGRTSCGEVLLTRYFRQALLRLNPWLTPNQLDEVQKKFTAHVSTASLMQINEEKYFLLRDGIPVTVKRPDGRTEIRSAAVIDFKNPENNHFLAVKEMKIHSQLYRCRTDIVGFVNGIPLLFIELKKPTVDVQNAYIDNYRNYLDTIPQLFYYNAFLMLSNGLEAKVGTLGSKYEFFHEWKRLKESDAGRVELETMLRGICEKKTFPRSAGKLHPLRPFRWAHHQDSGPQPPVSRRQRGRQCLREPQVKRRQAGGVLAHAGVRQKLLHGLSGAEDPAQVCRLAHHCGTDRP